MILNIFPIMPIKLSYDLFALIYQETKKIDIQFFHERIAKLV